MYALSIVTCRVADFLHGNDQNSILQPVTSILFYMYQLDVLFLPCTLQFAKVQDPLATVCTAGITCCH